MEILERLPAMELGQRSEAVERLLRNPSPGVRERTLRVAAAVLDDAQLVTCLHDDDDAVMRNAGLDILKLRGSRSFGLAVDLLSDQSVDVALQAVLLLDHLKDPRALEPLRRVLAHDDPNIVQAAIVAIGHLGDARAIPDLLPFLDSDPWLQMAVVQALGDLRSTQAVRPLSGLLTDLMIGPLACEALARIGGSAAFRALSAHWLEFHDRLDPETMLGLLAHVLEGLPRPVSAGDELRLSLGARLRDPYRGVRLSAARCLLALGAGPEDAEALSLLAQAGLEDASLPSCLARRRDLIPVLLERSGALRQWGYLLAARFPKSTPVGALAAALDDEGDPRPIEPLVAALTRNRAPELGRPLLDLYLRLPSRSHVALAPVLKAHKKSIRESLAGREQLRREDRIVLSAVLGVSARSIAAEIRELESGARSEVISQLLEVPAVLRRLPWSRWLEDEPAASAALAAQVAVSVPLRELLPDLRRTLRRSPGHSLIRAVGELNDRESLGTLLELLSGDRPALRLPVIESLGRIGGPEARRALRGLTGDGDRKIARAAYRALAQCATEDEEELFRQAIADSDWFVRLSCAEVLGRFSREANLQALTQLAADPVSIVAQRAISFLEE